MTWNQIINETRQRPDQKFTDFEKELSMKPTTCALSETNIDTISTNMTDKSILYGSLFTMHVMLDNIDYAEKYLKKIQSLRV